MLKVGDKIEIISMEGEPQYSGKTGTVTHTNVDPWEKHKYGELGVVVAYMKAKTPTNY